MIELSNADVTWNATYDGFVPRMSERANAALRADEETISALLELLLDPNRFVVAHVGLTRIAKLHYASFPTWNGLTVQMGADGVVTIPPDQCRELSRRWQSWHTSDPRPTTLP
jgi:hypothetical protein